MKTTLLKGDCVENMRSLDSQSIDLILTDPPYNLGNFMKNRQAGIQRMRENFFASAGWDNLDQSSWEESMSSFFEESSRLLKPGGSLLSFMAVIKVESLIRLAEQQGFYYKTTGTWHKSNPMPRNMNLHFVNSTEAWVYFTFKKRTGVFNNDGRVEHDFIESSVTPASEKRYGKHPTQKPVSIMEHFVRLLSNPGDTVLDPFMGSGSTGVAAVSQERNFTGIELDKEYFSIAKSRIKDANQWAKLL
ncbi:DNA-methyltransferase [Corynebacterium sp. S7]